MTKSRDLQGLLTYLGMLVALGISSFILKDRNDTSVFIVFLLLTVTYILSVSELRYIADSVFSFLLPVSLTITRTVWVAHPITDVSGIRSVSAGLFITATDIVLMYFLFRVIYFKKNRTNARIIMVAYVLCNIISLLFAEIAEYAFAGCFLYFKCFILYNWFSSHPYLEETKVSLLSGCKFALIFQGIIAILQKIKNGPIGLSFLGESDDALRYRIVGGSIDRGAAGTFEHSSRLAIFLIFVLLVILFNEDKKFKKHVYEVFGMIILFLAASRTAMLILVIALVYNMWKNRGKGVKKNTIILAMGMLVVGGLFLVIGLREKDMFAFITNSDVVYQVGRRLSHWMIAFQFIMRRFPLGYGINNYTVVMRSVSTGDFLYLNPVHNNYLLNWFELGLLGFGLYIALFIVYISKARNYENLSGFGKAAVLFLICVVVYNFTGWAFAAPTCIYFLWAAFGILEGENVNEEY